MNWPVVFPLEMPDFPLEMPLKDAFFPLLVPVMSLFTPFGLSLHQQALATKGNLTGQRRTVRPQG